MNTSLISLYFKKQSTIQTSVFVAEFVAMEVGMETFHVIQYKLRMMGIPITRASYISGYMLIIYNTSQPESTLVKKCNAIAYHAIDESVAMGESLKRHIRLECNPADLLLNVFNG